uniref:[RNA-polymerase]-subunit kinase n=1 Tax=Oryza meridionalis TaxID=40149 RepID=A0A0E0CSI8_9ORYZ
MSFSPFYLVFEYMDHDLTDLAATPGLHFTEPQVKCFMAQILVGLRNCHERSVLHRDIKGVNLLIDGDERVQDRRLRPRHLLRRRQAAAAHQPRRHALVPPIGAPPRRHRVRRRRRPLEHRLHACILAELLAGKPILPSQTKYGAKAKLPDVTLFKPQRPYRRKIAETFRDFSPPALDLLDTLLAIEPSDRGTAPPRAAVALDSDIELPYQRHVIATSDEDLVKLATNLETAQHLLKDYPFTREIWDKVTAGMEQNNVLQVYNPDERLIDWWEKRTLQQDKNQTKGMRSPHMLLCWEVWRERNRRVFKGKELSML